jgi:hypothetical protein
MKRKQELTDEVKGEVLKRYITREHENILNSLSLVAKEHTKDDFLLIARDELLQQHPIDVIDSGMVLRKAIQLAKNEVSEESNNSNKVEKILEKAEEKLTVLEKMVSKQIIENAGGSTVAIAKDNK